MTPSMTEREWHVAMATSNGETGSCLTSRCDGKKHVDSTVFTAHMSSPSSVRVPVCAKRMFYEWKIYEKSTVMVQR